MLPGKHKCYAEGLVDVNICSEVLLSMGSLTVFSLNDRSIRNLDKRKAIFLFGRKYFCEFYLI